MLLFTHLCPNSLSQTLQVRFFMSTWIFNACSSRHNWFTKVFHKLYKSVFSGANDSLSHAPLDINGSQEFCHRLYISVFSWTWIFKILIIDNTCILRLEQFWGRGPNKEKLYSTKTLVDQSTNKKRARSGDKECGVDIQRTAKKLKVLPILLYLNKLWRQLLIFILEIVEKNW